jgi:hypothetical protein
MNLTSKIPHMVGKRIDGKGYLAIGWRGCTCTAIFRLLDHKTRNPCRIADLRKATHSQNAA